MILINKNTSNTVVLTLNEKKTTLTCDLLFEFTNDMTGEVKLFTAIDSVDSTRYNQFTIIDNTIELPYAGQMNFSPAGYWTYVIYQMPITSPPSLDPADSVVILEKGKVFVIGEDCIVPSFNEDDTIDTPAFDPECDY